MAGSSLPARRRSAARTLVTTSGLLALVSGFLMLLAVAVPVRAYAAIVATVNLGTVDSFSVLGGQTVTNTGPSTLDGDLGVSPGDAITGFPPGTVGGATYKGNAKADQAQSDLTTAYNDADGRPKNATVPVDLVGQTLVGGVYESTGALELSGELTLDGEDNPDSVWIFKSSSTLITASNSSVNLTNGADACNVFWQVDSSATIGTGSDFVGTIMALASITVETGATVEGRALARNGAVTLDTNVFQSADCDEDTDSPTSTVTVTAPPVTVTPPAVTTTATQTVTEVPAGGESVPPTATATRTKTVEVPVAGESVTETVTATVTAGGGGGDQSTYGTSTNGTGGGNNNGGGTDNGSGGDSTGYLASTGSDVMSPYLGVAGLALLLVGGLLLARGHGRTRTSGKHR
jgi:hypothetical protein